MIVLHIKSTLSLTLQDSGRLKSLNHHVNESRGVTLRAKGVREAIAKNPILEQGHEAEIYKFVHLGWI